MSVPLYTNSNSLVDLSSNAIKINTNGNEVSKEDETSPFKQDWEFKEVFDAILSTFKSKLIDYQKPDCPDSDEFSSDSDDEETNLISQKLVTNATHAGKEQVWLFLLIFCLNSDKILILELEQRHQNHTLSWLRPHLFNNH